MQKISYYVQQIGKIFLDALIYVGQSTTIIFGITVNCFLPPWYGKKIVEQIIDIGIRSLSIVAMSSLFMGATFALQIYLGSSKINTESTLVTILVVSIVRQLGPVLLALIIAGRNSSAFAAEISSMQVTEQISAMKTLSVNPYRYLATPKIVASVICLPLLTIIADTLSIFGGYIIAVFKLGFNQGLFVKYVIMNLKWDDVVSGVIKSSVFGYIIAISGCHQGFLTQGGAQEVGRATTTAVVEAFILIFIANYFISELLFTI